MADQREAAHPSPPLDFITTTSSNGLESTSFSHPDLWFLLSIQVKIWRYQTSPTNELESPEVSFLILLELKDCAGGPFNSLASIRVSKDASLDQSLLKSTRTVQSHWIHPQKTDHLRRAIQHQSRVPSTLLQEKWDLPTFRRIPRMPQWMPLRSLKVQPTQDEWSTLLRQLWAEDIWRVIQVLRNSEHEKGSHLSSWYLCKEVSGR